MITTNHKASKENHSIIKILSSLSLIYLIIVPFGYLKKFEMTDVFILFAILLFNSEIIERLINLAINKDGITINLKEFQQEQDKQRDNIEANRDNIEANKNNIAAITDIIQRLTSLEQDLADSKNTTHFVVNSLLSYYEWQHLRRLANNETFNYNKQRSFEQELRHLRTLGFIENKPGIQISSLPESGDLRNFFTITERGKKYIRERENIELNYINNKVI